MANFAILRVGKIKSAVSVKGMLKHNFRTIDTPNADGELSKDNVHVAAKSVNDGMRKYRELLPDKVRKNAVHALDYMVTTSHESSKADNAKCIKAAYEFVCEKHGKENVIMASKHVDEKTPHIHIMVMPIDEKGKLNARKFIGGSKHRMSELQDEFYAKLKEQNINLDRGMKGSKAKHQSIKVWAEKQKQTDKSINLNVDKVAKVLTAQGEDKSKGMFKSESIDLRVSRVVSSATKIVKNLANKNTQLNADNKSLKQAVISQGPAIGKLMTLEREVSKGDKTTLDKLNQKADAVIERKMRNRSRGSEMEI